VPMGWQCHRCRAGEGVDLGLTKPPKRNPYARSARAFRIGVQSCRIYPRPCFAQEPLAIVGTAWPYPTTLAWSRVQSAVPLWFPRPESSAPPLPEGPSSIHVLAPASPYENLTPPECSRPFRLHFIMAYGHRPSNQPSSARRPVIPRTQAKPWPGFPVPIPTPLYRQALIGPNSGLAICRLRCPAISQCRLQCQSPGTTVGMGTGLGTMMSLRLWPQNCTPGWICRVKNRRWC
jgi:hypothetical protein